MIATLSPPESWIAVDSDRRWQFMTPPSIGIGHQVRVIIRALSRNIASRFATFADVPYHDPLSRQQWEQLWEETPRIPAD
jgi:hypothetical protein